MVQLYIGEGKGKTTAAIGLAVRAAGAGLKVAIVFFDKGEHPDASERPRYSERAILRSIPNVDVFSSGLPRFRQGCEFRGEMTEEDIREAKRGYDLAVRLLQEKAHALVVLDEILWLVRADVFEEKQLVALMELARTSPETELVLTGRVDSSVLIQHADLVTEMRNIKHYFNSGVPARRGIEY